MNSFKRLSLAAIFSILAAGCSVQPPSEPGQPSISSAGKNASELLQAAQSAPAEQASQLKRLAAEQLIAQNNPSRALEILNSISLAELSDGEKFAVVRAKTELALNSQDAQAALGYLEQLPNNSQLTQQQRFQLQVLTSEALGLSGDLQGQISRLINAYDYTSDPDKQQALNDRTWQTLVSLPRHQLSEWLAATEGTQLRGWLELAELAHRGLTHQNYTQWSQQWHNHPASNLPPSGLFEAVVPQSDLDNTQVSGSRIAIALPEQGKLGKAAKAIRTGIQSALAQRGGDLELITINTDTVQDSQQIIDIALEQGANIIIGPLSKDRVEELSFAGPLALPVLALNSVNQSNGNLYQFALSVEDEARDAAQRAFDEGRRQALVLTPNSDFGNRAASAFIDTFTGLGGSVTGQQTYNTQDGSLTNSIAQLLGINPGAVRGLQRKMKTGHLRHAIRNMRRSDADSIFLAANTAAARQVRPSILYYYAGDLPMYATSAVYRGRPDPVKDIDLNGIRFGDMPWVLAPQSGLKASIAQRHKNTQTRFGRLYAFGADALNLTQQLDSLSLDPSLNYQGETGSLTLTLENRIERQSQWAIFQAGTPELLATP